MQKPNRRLSAALLLYAGLAVIGIFLLDGWLLLAQLLLLGYLAFRTCIAADDEPMD